MTSNFYECDSTGEMCKDCLEQNFAVKSSEATEEELMESNRLVANDRADE